MDYYELKLFVYRTDDGFITEREDRNHTRHYYKGSFPHIELWISNPDLWVWLLERDLFDVIEEEENQKEEHLMLITSISNDSCPILSSRKFISEHDFIISLIDKIELELISGEQCIASDYMKLSTLERLCHKRDMNLLDFFYSLENDIPLSQNIETKLESTSAALYHRALEILLKAKSCSYRKLSELTGISRENLLSDKSDSLRGRRKTIEIRTLFRFTTALGISITTFLSLCTWINRYTLIETN